MLCRQRRGWGWALSSVWSSASNLSTQSSRLQPNGDFVVPRRGTGPHHIVFFVMAPEGQFRKPPLPAARVDNFSRGHALDTLSAPNPVRCGGPSHENGRAAPDL